jgi:hypothetical protein
MDIGDYSAKGSVSMTPTKIVSLGERYVTVWLQTHGYECYRNTQQLGSTDIEARSSSKSLLVQIKTALAPSAAPFLSDEEQCNITSRATKLGCEAWLAQLQVDGRGALVADIMWTKLN